MIRSPACGDSGTWPSPLAPSRDCSVYGLAQTGRVLDHRASDTAAVASRAPGAAAGLPPQQTDAAAPAGTSDAGPAVASFNLAGRYEDGRGVDKDEARAAALYVQACDGGVRGGCSNLGPMYESGQGVTKDARSGLQRGPGRRMSESRSVVQERNGRDQGREPRGDALQAGLRRGFRQRMLEPRHHVRDRSRRRTRRAPRRSTGRLATGASSPAATTSAA